MSYALFMCFQLIRNEKEKAMKNKLNYRFDFAHRCTAENCAYCQNGNCYSVYYNAHFQNQCNTFLKKGKTGYASEFAIRMMNAGFRFMVSDHYIDGRILSGDLEQPKVARLVTSHGRTFTAVLCNENGTDSDQYFNISNVEALRGYFMTIKKFKERNVKKVL